MNIEALEDFVYAVIRKERSQHLGVIIDWETAHELDEDVERSKKKLEEED